MTLIESILIFVIGFAGIIGLLFLLQRKKLAESFASAQADAKKVLDEARQEAERIIRSSSQEGKEESRKRRLRFEEEARKRKTEVNKLEKRIKQREQTLDTKLSQLERRDAELEARREKIATEEKKYQKLILDCELAIEKSQRTLEKIAHMSVDEARKELMISLEESAKKAAQEKIREIEANTRKEASKKAREIISLSVQKLASDYVNDSTITVIPLPNEEMKGRIIGREGRNIRAIEQATGVDLIIDDTPEAVIISCFNPLRREIAKLTLEKLIADGRIHPARIEETAERVEAEMATILLEFGEQAAFDVGITDLHPDILSMLGKLRFRTVGTQSILQHSVETAHICGMMAEELGLNVKRAKRAGLLHDIGKAVDHEQSGHHASLSAQICEKYNEHAEIIEAINWHHAEDLVNAQPLAVILGAANTLSANRPAARKELLASYIKRLDDMEKMVIDFKGIEKAYVLQAGREVRAIVESEGISDDEAAHLSDEIALRIRQALTFPGQVRITVLRESKCVEYAT